MSILSFTRSEHTDALQNDMRRVAQDAATVAQKHLVEPAAHVAIDAVAQARKFVNEQTVKAERMASAQWDRLAGWVSANTFAAIGAAFVGGIIFSAISRLSRR